MRKKLIFQISILLILLLVSMGAQAEEALDPNIPDSWFQPSKTASEMGITEFKQSPMLDEKVDKGELPTVEVRLPKDPPVIEPYDEIGKYGGTAIVNGTNLGFWTDLQSFTWGSPGIPSPDTSMMLPELVKGWEYSDDYKKITIFLYEGMKYSDGHSFTADDYIYWWENVAHNEELTPIPPEEWAPVPLIDVVKNDEYSITFHFEDEYPRLHLDAFQNGFGPYLGAPKHFLKQFNPDFVSEEKIQELAEEVGLDHWSDYYQRMNSDSLWHPEYKQQRPSLRPYIATKRTDTTLILERNPYYPFIDTEGNQLPYIDKIQLNLAHDREMINIKAATGEATFAARGLNQENIPLFKSNEAKENYNTSIYSFPRNVNTVMVNLTHKDPKLREIFQDVRFRKALSLAIDREDINNKLFFGEALAMQCTVAPVSDYYSDEFANAYAEYNPEKAKELLDEMGMVDINNDGWRQRPDGETFNPIFDEYLPELFLAGTETIVSSFKDIGLNVEINTISEALHGTRWNANEGDIHGHVIEGDDLSFVIEMGKYLAPSTSAAAAFSTPWPAWQIWRATGGREGMEPPEKIKQLIEYSQIVMTSTDDKKVNEAANKLLESQAENLWTIGTISMIPAPVIVSNKLKNVPVTGIWTWGGRYLKPYRSVQFYLDE